MNGNSVGEYNIEMLFRSLALVYTSVTNVSCPMTNNRLSLIVALILAIGVSSILWLRETFSARRRDFLSESQLALAALPNTFLWAWDRPEQLDFIDTDRVGVAYLAKTIRLRDQKISTRPRTLPLSLRENTKVIAVVRIESDNVQLSSLLEETANEVAELGKLKGVSGVQIDFDAPTSQRDFYRQLLSRVRQLLPLSTPLSITALASWCAGDNWLSDLPVDEAVPMLFRMGVDHNQFISRLQTDAEPFQQPCRSAVAVSTDELIQPPSRKRIYIFSPKAWTASSVNHALEIYQR